jgi:hypothetical protein
MVMSQACLLSLRKKNRQKMEIFFIKPVVQGFPPSRKVLSADQEIR